MMESCLQHGEVLIRCETLYFQLLKNPRNICDVTFSNPRNSGMLHVKNYFSPLNYSLGLWEATIQFGGSSSRRLGIIRVPIWEVLFLSDPCVLGCIF